MFPSRTLHDVRFGHVVLAHVVCPGATQVVHAPTGQPGASGRVLPAAAQLAVADGLAAVVEDEQPVPLARHAPPHHRAGRRLRVGPPHAAQTAAPLTGPRVTDSAAQRMGGVFRAAPGTSGKWSFTPPSVKRLLFFCIAKLRAIVS